MATPIEPVVRLMVLCDRMAADPANPKKVNLYGLINTIVVDDDAPFPIKLPEMTVYLSLSGGRGNGSAEIVVVDADTGQPVIVSGARTVTFGTNPLTTQRLSFRLLNCGFPSIGLYEVEFRYNGRTLAQQSVHIRRRTS